MKTLIVGGSSGLGLELAKQLKNKYEVFITGRKDPKVEGVNFLPFDIKSEDSLRHNIEEIFNHVSIINLFIYAAGFYQEGSITDLSVEDILIMNTVGLIAPQLLLRRILQKQNSLDGFIAITSTSQWTPRLKEPIYNAVKSGFGMLANSVSLDERIKKTMVAAPAGMKTNFWANTKMDTTEMLDPTWVAGQILDLWDGDYRYKYARILRQPPRVEVVEER